MKTDEEIKRELDVIDGFHIEKALEHLRHHEQGIQEYLADFVASLCDVNKDEMFAQTDIAHYAHARWLYWYAYRYMTNESYDKIARQAFHRNHLFAQRTIQNGTNKMSAMIDKEPIWKKRWTILKRIIKLKNDDALENKTDNTIVISVPKDIKDKVNIVIKEK